MNFYNLFFLMKNVIKAKLSFPLREFFIERRGVEIVKLFSVRKQCSIKIFNSLEGVENKSYGNNF